MSGDFQSEIKKCLGIGFAVLRARTRSGNGVAERFIRTLKALWVRTFKTVEELRAELVAFARRYNETWLVARRWIQNAREGSEKQTMPPICD